MSYILPQVQVFQEFRVLPTAVIANLNAFVFGANYKLFRYGVDSEKAMIGLGAYDKDNDTSYAYPMLPMGGTVDFEYVKLYMENVWAEYAQILASEANPLVVVSNTQRNRLRAAPVIGEAQEGQDGLTPITGVDMEAAGYFTGGVGLPEDYYLYPVGGWDGAAWDVDGYRSDISALGAEDAKLRYVTTENLSGIVDVNANAFPLQAGNWVAGPDGIQLDLDSGTDDVLQAPLRITFGSAGQSFTLGVNKSVIKTIIDWAVDLQKPLKINVDLGALANAVVWDGVENTLTVASDGTYDILDLYDDLGNNSDVATYFTLSTAPAGAEDVTTAVEQGALSVATGADIILVRDSYRIRVTPSPYTFATGNGTAFSAQFKSRGVRVGDRVRYQVTDEALVTHTGVTKVVGFEADVMMASIGDPFVKETNLANQVATNLVSGQPYIVAGSDNQRAMDGVNTRVFALDATNQKYPGSLFSGVMADSYRAVVTVPGLAGTARATVSNASGTYYRENVLIELAGADNGQLYVGDNLYINFDQGTGDLNAQFQVGDSYAFDPEIVADFTAPDDNVFDSGGKYIGASDTTYIVEVVRGGVFDRITNVIPGIQQPIDATALTSSVNWANWTGGDINDEYILRCTVPGTLTSAQFQVTSQRGDSQAPVQFSGTGVNAALGGRGLVAQFDTDVAFAAGDYWVIRVNAARPMVRVSDSAGIDGGSNVVVDNNEVVPLGGYGVTMTFASNLNTEGGFAADGGLRKGDVYFVRATAPADGAIKTLVLADDLPKSVIPGVTGSASNPEPDNFGVWLYLVQSSAEISSKKLQIPPYYNWTPDANAVTVNSQIAVQDASWTELDGTQPYLPVYNGDLFVEYRALLATYADTIRSIADIADVDVTFGTIHPDNPLSQGVYNALSNSGGQPVYYMAVPTDDHSGFLRVLDRASLNGKIYGFAPLTQDREILNSVEAHINALSTEENKRWRIGFVGTKMPIDASVYDLSKNPADVNYLAQIADDPATPGAQYTLVTFVTSDGDPSPYTQVLGDVLVGDKVRINFAVDPWGEGTYDEYTVAALMSNTVLKLVSGPAAPVTIPTKVEVWHNFSVQEMSDAVAAISRGFANRRMYHVFPGVLGAFGTQQTSEFAAAAAAGLVSSVPPQQGLTNIELNGFDDLPMVYATLNRAQLNWMAENGTMIIMQDVAGGEVYIRHQVSTNAKSGDLNQTELSITKNLDSISYYFAERLAPYIGRYNITPELLTVLRTQIMDGLMFLGSFTSIGLLGPQIILSGDASVGITGTSIERVEQHPTLLDHVVAVVNLRLPYPLNVIQLHLVV